ncbi:UNVERIFIED_CONTAM: hypothetical protein GTU68_018942, partial [Idotea baltica]|nr:hypothetical protein [Idotea baltica]
FSCSEIVAGADLKSLTSRVVRQKLEEKLSFSLSERKKEIDELVMAEVEDQTNSHSEEEEEEEEVSEEEVKKGGARKAKGFAKKRKADDDCDSDDDWNKKKAKGSAAAGGGRPKKASAFTKSFKLSPELADVVGSDVMPRHEVVKKLWAVIKERELQDPKNKQFAICDDQLLKVFGIKRFRTFGMMKHLKDHFLEAA